MREHAFSEDPTLSSHPGHGPFSDRIHTEPPLWIGSGQSLAPELKSARKGPLPHRARALAGDSGFGAGVNERGGSDTSSGDSPAGAAPRRRKRSRKRSSAKASESAASSAVAEAPRGASNDGADEPSSGSAEERRPRRRGKRGGRRRNRSKASEENSSDEPGEEQANEEQANEKQDREPTRASSAPATDSGSKKAGSRRRSKSSRRTTEPAESPDDEDEPTASDSEEGGEAKRKRKRGTRGGRRRKRTMRSAVEIDVIPGEEDDGVEPPDLPDDAVLLSKRSGKRTTRASSTKTKRVAGGRKKRSRESEIEDEPRPAARPKSRQILVNAVDPEETRVVVVEDGCIVDLQMTVKKHTSYVSDIYRGRVVNLEPAIGAAFVDFGQGRNGFLHASDVLPCYGESDWKLENLLTASMDEDWNHPEEGDIDDAEGESKSKGRGRTKGRTKRPRLPIEKLVKKGQLIAVQITKDAIGDKGPTLTTYISIPGRYLVLMPSLDRTGVSRKIEDEKERRRLKRILASLDIPDGMGLIVRTAGVGKTKAEIKRDLEYLLLAWDDFSRRLKSGRNPAPLYTESDVVIRTMRDLFTSETSDVVVDDADEYERMGAFTERLMPEFVDRVKLHDAPRPLLHAYGVEQDFEKIFSRRVELPSGGSIVFDQTEALVAIDVNSGRTREKGAEFEDIALKTNLEAAPEIARQIRLRDLGGIIVLDYIDMMRSGNRRLVEKATRESLLPDRARSKIGRISQFGLLELTRQRLGPGLSKLVYDTCQRCRGSGRQRTASSRGQMILRRLGTALYLKGFTSVEVRAHPEVIEHLKTNLSSELERLEEKSGKKLLLLAVPDQMEDSVLHYLRADGREVRPGGRRKR